MNSNSVFSTISGLKTLFELLNIIMFKPIGLTCNTGPVFNKIAKYRNLNCYII